MPFTRVNGQLHELRERLSEPPQWMRRPKSPAGGAMRVVCYSVGRKSAIVAFEQIFQMLSVCTSIR
jgi:hypothetical protein